ncbi:hypothetical protein H7I76_26590 [Mycolicibacterium vaccae]|nr:hypothetical protein [Mycolicibacterium vaccae]
MRVREICRRIGVCAEDAQRSTVVYVVGDDSDFPPRQTSVEHQSAGGANRVSNLSGDHVELITHGEPRPLADV